MLYLLASCFSIGQKPEEVCSCSMQMTTTADGKMLFLYSDVSDSHDQFPNCLCMVTYLQAFKFRCLMSSWVQASQQRSSGAYFLCRYPISEVRADNGFNY